MLVIFSLLLLILPKKPKDTFEKRLIILLFRKILMNNDFAAIMIVKIFYIEYFRGLIVKSVSSLIAYIEEDNEFTLILRNIFFLPVIFFFLVRIFFMILFIFQNACSWKLKLLIKPVFISLRAFFLNLGRLSYLQLLLDLIVF